jgi:hypothetical protein
MAELILVAVLGGLMAPIYANSCDTPAYDGHVYGCDDEPLEGVAVLINNTNENLLFTLYTNDTGYYFAPENKTCPLSGEFIRVTATYGDLSATKELVLSESGPLTVDFILCKETVPVFTSFAILVLIGLLSAIAALTLTRRKRL